MIKGKILFRIKNQKKIRFNYLLTKIKRKILSRIKNKKKNKS